MCLREILDEKTEAPTPFFQLVPQRVLPRFSAATTGFTTDDQCPICKRDGYYNIPHVPLKLAYDEVIPPFSVAETYEGFGKSGLREKFSESSFAVTFLVLDKELQNVLSAERGVEFVPVQFGTEYKM